MKEGSFGHETKAGAKPPEPANDNGRPLEHLKTPELEKWIAGLRTTAERELDKRRRAGGFDQDMANTWEFHVVNLTADELRSEIEDLTVRSCKKDPAYCIALLHALERKSRKV